VSADRESAREEASWTLEELSSRAEQVLGEHGLLERSADGRVSEAADPRTVRYYQTLGILDRPHSYEGRKARYGPRHLLELVAVKALQRSRLPLAEIQARLYGLSDGELESLIASVPRPDGELRVPVALVREVVLEPGLKLVADEGWSLGGDPERLVQLFRAVLSALGAKPPERSEP
jgi:DNA-binding transcriptional MerR regulator